MPLKIPNLDQIKNDHRFTAIGEAIDATVTALENVCQKISVNPQGPTGAPAPPSSITVTANASGIHRVSIADHSPRTRQVHYFIEHDTDPAFSNPQVEHLGVSRQRSLAQSMGATPVYYRAYSQYPDGPRSPIIYLGTQSNPTGVVDNAPTAGPAYHVSTGSGTAVSGGYGFGQDHFVPSPSLPGKPPKVF